MKKNLCMLLAAVAVFTVTGCKKNQKSDLKDAVAALKERKVFIIGLDDSFPPLGYRDDSNEIVGYDIDLAREVAKRLGVKFKVQPIDWDAKEMELETGKIDCIWNGFTITEERKTAISFTEAYLNNAQVLVVRADSGIKSFADVKGKIIGLQSGSSAQKAVDDNPDFSSLISKIILFKDNITAFNDLDIGGIDGVVMDSVVANYAIAKTQKPFIVIGDSLANEGYGIGFRKNEPELRDEVWSILKEMQADGTVASIGKKWFGKDLSVIK